MCKTALLDIMAPEAHQNDRSYIREFSGPTFDSLHKNLAWWVVTRRNHKTVKGGEGGHLPGTTSLPIVCSMVDFQMWFCLGAYKNRACTKSSTTGNMQNKLQ